jgi:hypothetical protein
VETFESEMDSGETLSTLALKYDVALEDLRAVMDQLHADALAEAVAQGTVTQEQADGVQSRRGGGAGRGFGMGAGPHDGYFGQGPCMTP